MEDHATTPTATERRPSPSACPGIRASSWRQAATAAEPRLVDQDQAADRGQEEGSCTL